MESGNNVRNFVIIAHIDSGKSTLADRLLEITGTVPMRSMRAQYLDRLPLERERGITIKMAPVRMLYAHPASINADETQMVADIKNADFCRSDADDADKDFLYGDLTYKIRGAAFEVWNKVGPGFRESIYQKALEIELQKRNVPFAAQPILKIEYDGAPIGDYHPDLLIDGKIIVELKALPFIGDTEKKQAWSYLKGSSHKLALLINFGPKKVDVERIIYDSVRDLHLRPSASRQRSSAQVEEYILNLIDTPGHSDFSYEVSRALIAVEGAILLIDGTKGIQAQTLSNLRAAQKAGLTIVPAVNKIDLGLTQIEKVVEATAELLNVPIESIFKISAKTGVGVKELLDEVVRSVPAPKNRSHVSVSNVSRALIFDSLYDDHKGIIANVRVFEGEFSTAEDMRLIASGASFKPKEVGFFSPDLVVANVIKTGEIGYIATGLKEPAMVKIGDTIVANGEGQMANGLKELALAGYKEVGPVVFISFYPDGGTKFDDLKKAFEKLRLNDAALSFDPDSNEALGRGLKVGFLGQLHFEITSSRLVSEYNLEFLTTFPSIAYRVRDKGIERIIKQPQDFPDKPEKVWEPLVALDILAPQSYLSSVLSLQTVFDIEIAEIKNIGDNLLIEAKMPLRELIRDFDDRLKSASQGYASFTYELSGEQETEVEKLEILVVDEVVPALTRIVPKKDLEREGRQTAERLKELLPQEQFSQAIQARSEGRIIARETIPAMKKELGNFGKNGGDRTRKMKLWKKQERGKERLQSTARVEISPEVFREILKK